MLLEDTSAFPAVWGQGYGGEGNSSRNHASPRSIINRCIMGKERDGCQPLDSFVSLVKSPSSRAPEGRRGLFEAETSCQGNGNISRCKSLGCQRDPNERGGWWGAGAPRTAWWEQGKEPKGNSGRLEPGPCPLPCTPFLHCSPVLIGSRPGSPGALPAAYRLSPVPLAGFSCIGQVKPLRLSHLSHMVKNVEIF